MKPLEDAGKTDALRTDLIGFLKNMELNGMAILAISQHAEPFVFDSGEPILSQGQHSEFIYFLMEGDTEVAVMIQEKQKIVGNRGAITMLGEIAFFNNTSATATVRVKGKRAMVLRLSFTDFRTVVENYPDVKATLARIGDMRVIRQYNGFISYKMFMETIGWPVDRFAINRAFAEDLENALSLVLLPMVKNGHRVLEVGDGPGVAAEMMHRARPELLENLFLQATHLEDAISDPLVPQPSDFLRGTGIKETFDVIIALQVYHVAARADVRPQFELAHRLLNPKGILLGVKTQLLDVRYAGASAESLIFETLEEVVHRHLPNALGGPLVETTFIDADLDPEMEWNKAFCEGVAQGRVALPDGLKDEEESLLLDLLLKQARRRIFDPEDLHYRWLAWVAAQSGFVQERTEKDPEKGFYYQLFRKS